MAKEKEYELIPIKPLKDLQTELKKLSAQISKSSQSPKELVKVLNSNLETQKTVKSIVKTIAQIKDQMGNMNKLFKDVDVDIGEEEDESINELLKRMDKIEGQNNKIMEELTNINEDLKRLSYFKERLPQGLPVVYKRSNQ